MWLFISKEKMPGIWNRAEIRSPCRAGVWRSGVTKERGVLAKKTPSSGHQGTHEKMSSLSAFLAWHLFMRSNHSRPIAATINTTTADHGADAVFSLGG